MLALVCSILSVAVMVLPQAARVPTQAHRVLTAFHAHACSPHLYSKLPDVPTHSRTAPSHTVASCTALHHTTPQPGSITSQPSPTPVTATPTPPLPFQTSRSARHDARNNLAGELIAFGTGCCFASFLLCARVVARRRPGVPIQAATGFGSFLAAAIGLSASLSQGDALAMPPACFAWVGLDAACVATAYLSFALAPKHLPAAEISVVFLLEPIVAPFWVFLRFGEVPTHSTFAGGALLLATLATHEIAGAQGCADGVASTPKDPYGSPALQPLQEPFLDVRLRGLTPVHLPPKDTVPSYLSLPHAANDTAARQLAGVRPASR